MEGIRKIPRKNLTGMEISDMPDKEFKETVIKMLSKLRSGMQICRKNFNKELENKRTKQI